MATVEVTMQKVQRILAAEFNDVMLQEDGFAIEHGSTRVNVEVLDWGKDPDGNPSSIVQVWAPVSREVKPSPDFFRWAAIEGQKFTFGSVKVLEAEDGKECFVMFGHTLLGDYLDPAELVTTVALLASTADDIDDVVHTKFGGKRYTDA
jgi:hypothetical protein